MTQGRFEARLLPALITGMSRLQGSTETASRRVSGMACAQPGGLFFFLGSGEEELGGLKKMIMRVHVVVSFD